jgi:hypothetical protein
VEEISPSLMIRSSIWIDIGMTLLLGESGQRFFRNTVARVHNKIDADEPESKSNSGVLISNTSDSIDNCHNIYF